MLSIERTGLIVVDVQGKLARLIHDSDTLISNCAKLIQGVKALKLPIILLEQNPEKLGGTVTELKTHFENVPAITKCTFNACDSAEFLHTANTMEIDTWLICGIETHICVYQTARGLLDSGFNVELVSDCVSSRTLSNMQLGINRAKACGAEVTGLEMCLYELVKDCQSPEFKQILSLIR